MVPSAVPRDKRECRCQVLAFPPIARIALSRSIAAHAQIQFQNPPRPSGPLPQAQELFVSTPISQPLLRYVRIIPAKNLSWNSPPHRPLESPPLILTLASLCHNFSPWPTFRFSICPFSPQHRPPKNNPWAAQSMKSAARQASSPSLATAFRTKSLIVPGIPLALSLICPSRKNSP